MQNWNIRPIFGFLVGERQSKRSPKPETVPNDTASVLSSWGAGAQRQPCQRMNKPLSDSPTTSKLTSHPKYQLVCSVERQRRFCTGSCPSGTAVSGVGCFWTGRGGGAGRGKTVWAQPNPNWRNLNIRILDNFVHRMQDNQAFLVSDWADGYLKDPKQILQISSFQRIKSNE